MLTKTVKIVNKLGLHARASSKLVMLSNTFTSNITISKDNRLANAKSLMNVMMLAANNGSVVTISVDGADESLALKEIVTLINGKFGEVE